jgi:hypothetical protein
MILRNQEGSLPCSQEPAAGPYTEPHESSRQPVIPRLQNQVSYFHSIYSYVFQVISFLQRSHMKACAFTAFPMRATPKHPMAIFLYFTIIIILSEEQKLHHIQ